LYPSSLIPSEGVQHEHVVSHAAHVVGAARPWLDADEWFSRNPDRTEPRLNRRRRAITSRRQPQPTEFDGRVGPLGDLDPFTRTTADGLRAQSGITSFEDWIHCGVRYFVTRVLGAPIDDTDPSDIVDVEPRDKGTLVHRVFECLLNEFIEANPTLDRPWIADRNDLERVLHRAGQILDDEAATRLEQHRLGHPQMWRARRAQIMVALRRGLEAELADGATPLATELSFGARNGAEPVIWHSPVHPDLEVHFAGSIDRLDRMPDGSVRVMDLKSGKDDPYSTINQDTPLGAATDKLQLAFYGWAAGQVRGFDVQQAAYRFVGRHDRNPDVRLQLTPQVTDALHERLDDIADHIRRGEFVPGEVGTWGCEVCSPDGLGADETNQRLAEWLAAATQESSSPESSSPESSSPESSSPESSSPESSSPESSSEESS
jgi:RecB family exonuclease